MSWVIGFKDGESFETMEVSVDECSPKEHYLYLYDQYEEVSEEATVDEDGDVVSLEPKVYAKVMGFFPPATWVFAVKDEVLVVPDAPGDTGE